MPAEWPQLLKESRLRLGLTRPQMAGLTRLSYETIRAYESGRRTPSRESLGSLLDALKVDRLERNRILMSAGFAPDGRSLGPHNLDLEFTVDEASQEIEKYDWPAHVNNEMMVVLAANRAAQRLWGIDLHRDFAGPVERNMLSVGSHPQFADKVVNWDEVVAVAIAIMKGHHRGPETLPEGSGAYFAAVMKHFLNGEPRYVRRFLDLWDKTPPVPGGKRRWSYRIVWNEPGVGIMRFHVFSSSANGLDGLTFQDWIPTDAATWQGLQAIAKRSN